MRQETERWLRHARDDFETARVTLRGRRWAATSFHAQQSIEKALKAMWVERKQVAPPRVHDLVRLGEEFDVPAAWSADLDALTRAYAVSRYPDIVIDDQVNTMGPERARMHLELAERVLAWVEQALATA